MKLKKKHYIWGIAIIVVVLIFVYRKELMKAAGFDDSTIRKFCGGGFLGYGGWFSPSYISYKPTPPVNAYTQSIYRMSCGDPYFENGKWNVKCSYPGLMGNFYETIGCADTPERATEKAVYQIENNFNLTRSRQIPNTVYSAGIVS